MNLNVDKWEIFDFDKIFEIKKGFYNKKPDSSGLGCIPFLGATDKNNGVTEYYTLDEIESTSKTGKGINEDLERKIFPGNAVCVTNNGSVGYAYYQSRPFTCSHDVNPLYLKNGEFNYYTGLFIATVIMHDRYRWGYGRKWRPERMNKSKLKLPILRDSNGLPIIDEKKTYSDKGYIPDWNMMESYIKSLKSKRITTKIKSNRMEIDTTKWKEFVLGELFTEIYKSQANIKAELSTIKEYRENAIRYITRTDMNNGCDCYVDDKEVSGLEKGGAIIIGDTTSTCFYQEKDFLTGDHIVVCRADWLNKYTALFLKTILEKDRYRYSYGRAFKTDLIKTTKILLPATKSGNPDWKWIEKYIRSLPYSDKI